MKDRKALFSIEPSSFVNAFTWKVGLLIIHVEHKIYSKEYLKGLY